MLYQIVNKTLATGKVGVDGSPALIYLPPLLPEPGAPIPRDLIA